jgi:hypothetical protein
MKKSTWVIEIDDYTYARGVFWVIKNRQHPQSTFTTKTTYTSRYSAIRGAKRMAKRLRINAEVE